MKLYSFIDLWLEKSTGFLIEIHTLNHFKKYIKHLIGVYQSVIMFFNFQKPPSSQYICVVDLFYCLFAQVRSSAF